MARAIKFFNFLLHRALLPAEARVGRQINLEHYALGIVMHPNLTIGDDVRIYHHVTLAGEMSLDSTCRIEIGDRVTLGANCVVIAPPHVGISIGDDAVIGAGSVVTGDVPPRAIVTGNPGMVHRYRTDEEIRDPYAASLKRAVRRRTKSSVNNELRDS